MPPIWQIIIINNYPYYLIIVSEITIEVLYENRENF